MNDLHGPQRAMRRRLASARQSGTAAILDIGTSKVCCAIVKFQSDIDREGTLQTHIEVLGAGQTMSLGVECGDIAAPPETETAIRSAVTKAQAMAKMPADLAIACLSASYPESGLFVGSTPLRSGAVEETDLSRSLASCNTPEPKPGRETLHALPVYFGVDQRKELADPRGQIGNRLYATLHLVSVDRAPLEVAAGCLRNCDLRIAGLVSTAYASGLACLTEDEQEIGAACLDIGAGTTDIAVFRKKHMVATDSIRLGGNHVTSDIAEAFGISRQGAEGIKMRHGGAVAGFARQQANDPARQTEQFGRRATGDFARRTDRHHSTANDRDTRRIAQRTRQGRHVQRPGGSDRVDRRLLGPARNLNFWRVKFSATGCGFRDRCMSRACPRRCLRRRFLP